MTSNTSDFENAVVDLNEALSAHDAVNANFSMATCLTCHAMQYISTTSSLMTPGGWVLGPLPDRTIFDKVWFGFMHHLQCMQRGMILY